MRGSASLRGRSDFVSARVSATGSSRRRSRRRSARPSSSAAGATKLTERSGAAPASAANCRRPKTGWGVGIDALASPIGAQAIAPPFSTRRGRMPKKAGSQSTRSASLPTATEPTSASMPCATAGQIVYFATYRRARSLSAGPCAPSMPRRRFIAWAVCQVRMMVSPTRPIAWLSEPIIEIAPRSCRTSSAAIVDGRMRDSANARSSGTRGLRWWQTMSMSWCSTTVLIVCGRVGFVELGSTLGCAAMAMMSGAWPPPAPSVW